MAEIIKCDFCGNEIKPYAFHYCKHGGRLAFAGEGETKSNVSAKHNQYDLCAECCKLVIAFIDDCGRRYHDII